MAENKTKPTNTDVEKFIANIDEDKQKDSRIIINLMQSITNEKPVLWGESLIGFGNYHYKYASGREGDYFLTGFSPRKQNLTLYIMPGFEKFDSLMQNLGKYKTGKSCLYVKKLEDINLEILKSLITESVKMMKKQN